MENNFRKPTGLARCASVMLAAVLVSCADGITRPPESPELTLQSATNRNAVEPSDSKKPRIPKLADADVVIMERTTDIDADNGRQATHRKLTKKLVGQVRLGKEEGFDGNGNEHKFDLENLPQPPISLPARYKNALCAAAPGWKEHLRNSAITGADVEMSGFGDAPPSTLRYVRDGKTSFAVERTWVRTPHTWQLERQVTTSTDGKYRDVVTYQHVTAAGRPANKAIPITDCSTASTGGLLNDYVSKFPAGPVNLQSDDCSGLDYGSDPCFGKQSEVYKADAALAVAATGLTIACRVVNPIVATACVAASAVYGAAVFNLWLAERALDECRREQRAKTCGCGTPVNLSAASGAASSLASFVFQRSLFMESANSYASSFYDCGSYPPGSSPGGGGGGSGSDCSWQVWEISYDGGVTWEYLGTFWTCTS